MKKYLIGLILLAALPVLAAKLGFDDQADKETFLASVDAIGEAKKLIKQTDTFGATVAQQPYVMGQLGIRYAMQYITKAKKDFDPFIPVPVKLITKENVDK